MQEFAAWLETTRISKTLFDTTWLWPACESLHFVGLCMLIGGAGLLDLRLMGCFRGLPIRDVKALMPGHGCRAAFLDVSRDSRLW